MPPQQGQAQLEFLSNLSSVPANEASQPIVVVVSSLLSDSLGSGKP